MAETQVAKPSALSPVSMKEAAAVASALDRAKRQRAAREQVEKLEPESVPTAKVRITHKGDGLVSMGQHIAGIGEAFYEKGEIVEVPQPTAEALQDRGLAEIVD